MAKKRKFQIVVDIVMIAMLPFLMAYQLIGEAAHEWLGICMFLLLIFHHLLNLHWHKSLLKGRYNKLRTAITVIDILLFIISFLLAISGIMMSKHIFTFLSIERGIGGARITHLLASYWGFVFMSVHTGMHWNMILGIMNRIVWKNGKSVWRTAGSKIAVTALCCYGIYAFAKRQLGDYMLLKTEFVFFDFGEPIFFFLADYAAVIILFASIGHYACKLLRNNNKKERE